MKITLHDYGGYEFIFDLASHLAMQGDEVTYIYSAAEAPKCTFDAKSARGGRLDVIPLTAGDRTPDESLLQRRRHERRYGKALAKILSKMHSDVVILTNTPLDVLAAVQPVIDRSKTKLINWLQDIRGIAAKRILQKKLPLLGSVVGGHYLRLERRLVRAADAIIIPSGDFVAEMNRAGYILPPVFEHPNWMPVETLRPLPKDNAWSRKAGITNTVNICYYGTLGFKQSLEDFLTVARYVSAHPTARFVITAAGPAVENLSRALRQENLSNVILLPWQNYAYYTEMLASADILLSVSTDDAAAFSIPSKILGYLCAGRPVLAVTPRGSPTARQLIGNDMGAVADPNDREGLVAALDRLFGDRAMRERFSRNARAYAEANFLIVRQTKAFRSILDTVCAGEIPDIVELGEARVVGR
jgi:glycosyltransferase involved in cell wall biosynthesis